MHNEYYLNRFWLIIVSGLFMNPMFGQVQPNKPATATQVPTPIANVAPVPAAYPPTTFINYVRTKAALSAITNETNINTAGYIDVKQSTQYLDGLGRPIQAVNKQITPGSSPKDIVMPVIYDEFGRETYKYMPYISSTSDGNFKLDPFNEQRSFLQAQYPGEQVFYNKINFETSPLNRVEKLLAQGNSWAGNDRGVSKKYWTNTTADQVIKFRASTYNNYIVFFDEGFDNLKPDYIARYPAGELSKNVTVDEHNNAVVEYNDKSGNLILKKVQIEASVPSDYSGYNGFLCTYYLYDDLNRLTVVIPPKVVTSILAYGYFYSSYPWIDMCYCYAYDGRNRMVSKKVPDGLTTAMFYDKRDRIVAKSTLFADGYFATLYDNLNRPVVTGTFGWDLGNKDLQDYIDQNFNTDNGNRVVSSIGSFPDLTLFYRDESSSIYQASGSITFEPPFTTETGAEFTAYVNGTLGNQGGVVQVPFNPLPNSLSPVNFTYYDDYSWTDKHFNTTFGPFLDGGGNPNQDPWPSQVSAAKGMMTGTKYVAFNPDYNNQEIVRWLTQIMYYDDKGRVIQIQQDNILGGTDITSNSYNFSGNLITSYQVHANPQTNTNLGVKTNYLYDHAGRLLKETITIYNNGFVNTPSYSSVVLENEYDDLGQLKTRKIGKRKDDQGYTDEPLGQLDYTYNVRGWLKSINKDFANGIDGNTTGSIFQWFGMELSYDWGYQHNQYNGNIAGIKWRSKGDGIQRSYGFGYDMANRVLSSDFSEGTGNTYSDNLLSDFDSQMGDGQHSSTAYDENGNILAMKQSGIKSGSNHVIDDLHYTYRPGTDQLLDVADAQNDPNSTLGDFNDRSTSDLSAAVGSKYQYDVAGNMNLDIHKGIFEKYPGSDFIGPGISYNYLNLPYQISMYSMTDNPAKKGNIFYKYDASGTKLEKRTIEFGSVANGQQKKYTSTSYVGDIVYENTGATTDVLSNAGSLQFINTSEGRIRPITLPDGTGSYAFDYMIKDHLGNVRTVLTDEYKIDAYVPASMETSKGENEKKYYSKIDETRTSISQITCYPSSDTYTTPNDMVSRLNGSDNKIGPGITLKVMAGDKFNIRVTSWYKTGLTTPQQKPVAPTVIEDILSGLAGGISAQPGNHIAIPSLQDPAIMTSGITDFFSRRDMNTLPNKPKAFVNWILFDDHFKFVQSSSGADQVPDESSFGNCPNAQVHLHPIQDKEITKNGYLYVYVSNETPNIDVFFDNLQVTHIRGPLVEESHYYPFGLSMAGIGSRALDFGGPSNRKKFNGGNELQSQEFSDCSGLETYDAHFRMYDPQIGRFMQVDPMSGYFYDWSPYSYANANPVLLNDPLGLASDTAWKTLPNITVGSKPKPKMITINNSPGIGFRKNPNYNPLINNPGASFIRYQAWNGLNSAHPEQMSYGEAALGLAAWLPWGAAVKGVGWLFRVYKAGQLIEASVGAARYLELFKPINEYDLVTTLYRGTTGSEATSSVLFLTDDAAVAATYIKNGGQVVSYDVTQFALKSLQASGELSLKTGIHGTTGVISTEYMFQGKNLVEALNFVAK